MTLPPGYCKAGHCAKLKKYIYGLKQSPREWYGCLFIFLTKCGFHSTVFDPCIFVRHENGITLFTAIYIDDITLFGPIH